MKKLGMVLGITILALLCGGCGAVVSGAAAETVGTDFSEHRLSYALAAEDTDSFSGWMAGATAVAFDGAQVSVDGAGADVSGGSAADGGAVVTISQAGTYVFSGQTDDGQILVYVGKEDAVRLVLDGLSLKNPEGAAIHIMQAEKTVLILADGSENTLADGASYAAVDEKGEPDAALFSKDDLTITGGGSLSVTASYADGIVSKDVLCVTGGSLTIDAADDGLRGTDGLVIAGGDLTVRAGGDAVKSTKDEDAQKGFVLITGGALTVPECYEGIEAPRIQIDGGTITVNASDDAINGATNTDSGTDTGTGAAGRDARTQGGRPDGGGWGGFGDMGGGAADYVFVRITGGTLDLTGANDGIDVNVALYIDGGDLTITGPSRGMDGAIDLDGKLTVTGGTLHVTGSVSAMGGVEGWDVPEENQSITEGGAGGGFGGGMRQDDGAGGRGGGFGGPGGGRPAQGAPS
ncbi:MAG: carbohydrate-binding domain-containing protein [Clostridiales Family XIII bacterium]|jgi:hypothetical protein|nr:carbohydrate-binding domain-containing protein [Clostridiales Family XIII bacterium]